MKVIFLKQVPNVAKKFDVKDVADGYALNHLFPQSLAEMATEKALARLEKLKATHEAELKIQIDLLAKNLESLAHVSIELNKKANDKGHLFDSIHKDLIIEELANQAHINLLPEFIELAKPIKAVGEHEISVKIGDKTGSFKVVVNAL